jgi:hypothetical protein
MWEVSFIINMHFSSEFMNCELMHNPNSITVMRNHYFLKIRKLRGRRFVCRPIGQLAYTILSNKIINYHSHFSPSLCNFVDVLKFTLQKHSSLPIHTLHVSGQLAIIRCTSCRGNCCPAVTLLHFAF